MASFLCAVAYFILIHFVHAVVDPEAYMSAVEIIRYWGYPVEIHEVMTGDGYILNLFRIPHGKHSQTNSSCHRPAVLFVHALVGSASEFILNPPESCPAFLLADAGFDVYLLNHRGTTYSKRHITLKPWDNKFWQFTMDEYAKYDVPAVIDKVLELSHQNSLYMVGHSQGTTVGFMTLSDFPEYNRKVNGLFQLAPPGTASYGKGILRLIPLIKFIKPIADLYRNVLGSHEVAFQWSFLYRPRLCEIIPIVGSYVCNNIISQGIVGPSSRSLNVSRTAILLAHFPSGTSTWNYLHWAQMISSRRVEHMDHNPLENIQRYGQETPPPYNYAKVDVPVYLFWSEADWVTTPAELEKIVLPTPRKEVVKGGRHITGYNHIDYVFAPDCGEMVYKPITEIVRRQESEMCER